MAVNEFELIERYFSAVGRRRDDVVLGVGDDAAIVTPPEGHELVVSVDTMVSGVHFYANVAPELLGHKVLAVNLSDLAAMGAQPAWATLALTLPQVDEAWLSRFSDGFTTLATEFGVQLIGGDTTRGPLTISVQVMGFVKQGMAWRRDGAQPGDLIYVTGTLGDAGLALQATAQQLSLPQRAIAYLKRRLESPAPRIAEALALNGVVNAAIDISDGLLSDLGHILQASDVGAVIDQEALPLSAAFKACQAYQSEQRLPSLFWLMLPLSAGDDYELCFTIAPERQDEVEQRLAQQGLLAHRIGLIDHQPGLRCRLADGSVIEPAQRGYEHFR